MDRRDALKKMAATGVVVSGASAIASSTAFADGGTPNSLPDTGGGGTVTFRASTITRDKGQKDVSITFGVPDGSCPDGATVSRQYRWDWGTTSSGWRPTPPTATFRITGSYVEVTATVRWICGGNWKCESYEARVESISGGGNAGEVRINEGSYSTTSATATVGSQGSGPFCDLQPPS